MKNLLYGEITALCNKTGQCFATNNYFAELYKVEVETISRWISHLVKNGFITSNIEKENGNARYIQLNQYLLTKKSIPIDKKINRGIDKKINNNNTNNNNTNNITSNIKEKEIFDYWNAKEIIQHKELTTSILKAIQKAMKEYSVEQIKNYIDRYNAIIKDKTYYFDTKWTLAEFLKQSNAISNFADDGSKWLNYKNREKKEKPKTNNSWVEDMNDLQRKIMSMDLK